MAQLERNRRSVESPKAPRAPTSPTFEQLLRVEDAQWGPAFGLHHDQEEYTSPTHNKKSVLTKVKERAKKLRHSLSGKKRHENEPHHDNSTPSWGVTLDDNYDDEQVDDAEYLGAPMYESEAAPENLKEIARQHPREVHVVPENHLLPNNTKRESAHDNDKPINPNKTISETVSDKLAPAYAAVSDATHAIATKIAGLTVTAPEAEGRAANGLQIHSGARETATSAVGSAVPQDAGHDDKKMGETRAMKQSAVSSPQKWDKGVSVKEYFMNKLEPGEDERALSQAITYAISPRKNATDTGVVEKVKDAVTSFFWQEHPSDTMAKVGSSSSAAVPVSSTISSAGPQNSIATATVHSRAGSSGPIPVSSNAHEVIEEGNYGRILQAN